MYERNELFIDGAMVTPLSGEKIEIISPATETVIGTVPAANTQDIDRAVAAARRAFDEGPWPRMSEAERRAIVLRAGELLQKHGDDISRLVSNQNGVVIRDEPGETASSFQYYGNLPLPKPEHRPMTPEHSAMVVQEPVGVVAAIVPWNSPIFLGLSKILPALMAGNSVVLKPAPETPLQDYLIVEAFAEAGLPAGVLNLVPAHREPAEALVRHPDVDLVSFTGSTAAGRRIGAICGERIRYAILELGGKSAAILLPDADLATAAPLALRTGVLMNNGEACTAWSRILAPRSRYDEAVDALVAVMQDTTVGDPLDPASQVGPMVADRQRERVEGYIAKGLEEGARLATGGGRPSGLDRGYYVEPTLFVDATNSMTIAREEIFGPVAMVLPYDDEDEAVRIANGTNYGLSGSIYTTDPERGVEMAKRIRSGTVAVNDCIPASHAYPFGGYKDSGLGRAHGPEGLAEYLETKTISLPMGFRPTDLA